MLSNRFQLDHSSLNELISKFSTKNILVVGDLMVDIYLRGKVSRISPEAPVPVLLYDNEERRLGGAGNVGLNLATLGAKVYMAGMISDDEAGNDLINNFESNRIDTKLIFRNKSQTSVKTRVIAEQQQIVRIDRETKDELSPELLEDFIEKLTALHQSEKFDAIIISDYGKGMISSVSFDSVKEFAHEQQIFLAVDPKENNFPLYHQIDIMTPNEKEAYFSVGESIGYQSEVERMASLKNTGKKIIDKYQLKNLLITLGKNGMALFSGGKMIIIPTYAQTVFDVSGAGDTVISTFVLSYLCETNLINTAVIANLAAGVVVSKFGTSIITPEEIITAFDHYQEIDMEEKINKEMILVDY